MTTVTVSKKALDALIKLARTHEIDGMNEPLYEKKQRLMKIGFDHYSYDGIDEFREEAIEEAIQAADHIEYLS